MVELNKAGYTQLRVVVSDVPSVLWQAVPEIQIKIGQESTEIDSTISLNHIDCKVEKDKQTDRQTDTKQTERQIERQTERKP